MCYYCSSISQHCSKRILTVFAQILQRCDLKSIYFLFFFFSFYSQSIETQTESKELGERNRDGETQTTKGFVKTAKCEGNYVVINHLTSYVFLLLSSKPERWWIHIRFNFSSSNATNVTKVSAPNFISRCTSTIASSASDADDGPQIDIRKTVKCGRGKFTDAHTVTVG